MNDSRALFIVFILLTNQFSLERGVNKKSRYSIIVMYELHSFILVKGHSGTFIIILYSKKKICSL